MSDTRSNKHNLHEPSPPIGGRSIRLARNGSIFPFGSTPLWVNPTPKTITATLDGETVAKSDRVLLAHEHGKTPVYYFPVEDVKSSRLALKSDRQPVKAKLGQLNYYVATSGKYRGQSIGWCYLDPIPAAEALSNHIAFFFDRIDQWHEDGDRIYGSPPDPFVRIDIRSLPATLSIFHQRQLLVESDRTKVLYETGLPPRFYLPTLDIRAPLRPSGKSSVCVYKGVANYAHIATDGGLLENVAWSYLEPTNESAAIAGMWCFDLNKFPQTYLNERRVLAPIGRADGKPVLTRGDHAGDTDQEKYPSNNERLAK